ncbi:unnamed protein product, partial [Polarella glacialis]
MLGINPGEALARDFLALEAEKQRLEAKQWQSLEEIQLRRSTTEMQRSASVGMLEKKLHRSGLALASTTERNQVIRMQASSFQQHVRTQAPEQGSSGQGPGGRSEAVERLRDSRQAFALQVERMSSQWHQTCEQRVRQEIEQARRDTQHCQARQTETLE